MEVRPMSEVILGVSAFVVGFMVNMIVMSARYTTTVDCVRCGDYYKDEFTKIHVEVTEIKATLARMNNTVMRLAVSLDKGDVVLQR